MTQTIAWDAHSGLVPAIVQDWRSGEVLMLAYMNADALAITRSTGNVTFYSRSRQRLWTKGEISGNFLRFKELGADCDGDTLLVLAEPLGPSCHHGTRTCWGEGPPLPRLLELSFLPELEAIIAQRVQDRPAGSYTTRLLEDGPQRIAQKIGEEGVELALAAVAQSDDEVLNEAADLLFHVMVLLSARSLSLAQLSEVLRRRHNGAAR